MQVAPADTKPSNPEKAPPASKPARLRLKGAMRRVQRANFGLREARARLVFGPALWQVLRRNRGATVIRPELYLQAAGEAFLGTMAVTWVATYIGNRDIISSNRINDIFAYNNVCVGFDSAPARYFAQPLFAVQSYLGIRYASLDQLRAELELKALRVGAGKYWFTSVMNALYAITMLFWPMLLIVTPDAGGTGLNFHFYIYVLFVVIMYLKVVAAFTHAPREGISRLSIAWMSVWGVWTMLLLVIGFAGFNGYDYAQCPSDDVKALQLAGTYAALCQQDPVVPVGLMATLDYGWFVLLCLTTLLLPYAPPLNAPAALIVGDSAL